MLAIAQNFIGEALYVQAAYLRLKLHHARKNLKTPNKREIRHEDRLDEEDYLPS
jgi:hypothetical protein